MRRPGQSNLPGNVGNAASPSEILAAGGTRGLGGAPRLGGDDLVYMGDVLSLPTRVRRPGGGRTQLTELPGVTTPSMLTVDQAVMEFHRLPTNERDEWTRTAERFYNRSVTPSSAFSLWKDTVGFISSFTKATGDLVTPQSYLSQLADQAEANRQQRDGADGAYMGPVTTQTTERRVNLTNPTEARAFLDNALGQYLGRRPSVEEYDNFRKALNIQERGAPQIRESTQTVTPEGQAFRTVEAEEETRGGFLPQQFAREFARGQEGAGEAAATGLLTSFLELLRGE